MTANRREFLHAAAGAGAFLSLGGAVPGWLLRAARSAEERRRDKVLVVLQLSGGNDGLNTVVPIGDPAYYAARPELAIARDRALRIDESLGFHPSLRGFADLLEAGKLSIVQGVGYPDPNRSHFESMDIWHTCLRKDAPRRSGWLGRYLDRFAAGSGGDVPALHLGSEEQPQALAAQRVRVPSVRSLDRFRLQQVSGGNDRETMRRLVEAERATENDLLGFVQSSATAALDASERVERVGDTYRTDVSYPETELGGKLKTIAQLIDAGLSTRIYYLTLDGFDTHAQQADAHAALLGQLGGAVRTFLEDVAGHDHASRVLVMCFSEFGRRVQENASGGTDHGAAAPMFLAGEGVHPGPLGAHPSLTDLEQGDLKFHTDFRQVYATVLQRWLGCDSEELLGASFAPVDALPENA